MRFGSSFLLTLATTCLLVSAQPIQQQHAFMSPDEHGDIWSLCDDPSSHTLRGYENGVYIFPAVPHTGEDINVKIKGNLLSEVTGGKVSIDLKLLSMIKINKELDLCSVLQSDIMNHNHCPLNAGDLLLEAKAFIPREIPKLPLDGIIRISDQNDQTVTCIRLNFNLQ